MVGVAVVAAFVAGAGVAGWRGGLGTSVTVVTEPPEMPVTAAVVRRELVDVVVVRGSAAFTETVTVGPPDVGDARPVVTDLPVVVGDEVAEGNLVAAVADRPVIVLEGAFPAYRNLARGVEGADVRQLQLALARLGLYDDERDGRFGRSTERAVRKLYEDRGFEPPVEVSVETVMPTGEGELPRERTKRTLRVPVGELAFVSELPSRVASVHVAVGDLAEGSSGLVDLAAGSVRITAEVPAAEIGRIEVGAEAELLDEISGRTATATVVEIGAAAASESGLRVHPVVLEPDEALDELVGKNLRVTFRLAETDGPVLAVPITAVWTSGEETFVTVVDGEVERDVAVQVGVVAGGWVEIVDAGGGLDEDDEVVVAR